MAQNDHIWVVASTCLYVGLSLGVSALLCAVSYLIKANIGVSKNHNQIR
jgi:hypothetical protein